jgi:sugar phosphate permease
MTQANSQATIPRAIERSAMGKLNMRIVPFLMVCYLIAYIDRVNAGVAALQMNGDLDLTAAMFGFGATLFYIAYTAFEVPSNVAMTKFGARIWMARIMITWGLVGIAAALVTERYGFYITRFLLGAAEAGFFPGALYYVSQWYPMAYRGRAVAAFSLAVPLSIFVGAPLGGLLMELDGAFGLRGWQLLFIMESLPAIGLGFICLFFLKDKPQDARWLSTEEKEWLAGRLAAEHSEKKLVAHGGLLKTLFNPYVLLFGLIYAGASATSNSLALWMPQILKTFKLSNLESALVTAIPYGLACVAMIYWGRRADKHGERIWSTAIPLAVTAIALLATISTASLVVTIGLLSLALMANYSIKGPFWSLVGGSLPAAHAAAGFAMVNTLAHVGTSITVWAIGLIKDATGSFPIGLLPLVALTAVGCLTTLAIGHQQRKQGALELRSGLVVGAP